jgi:2-haloacid dehalogenase
MMNAKTPAASRRPAAVAFDVNETLTNLAPLQEVFDRIGLNGNAMKWWFAVLLRDGFALTAAGDAAQFGDLAQSALDEVAGLSGQHLPDGATTQVMDAFRRVPLHLDVSPALDRLRSAGVAAFALTNGSAPLARQILGAAGVVEQFNDVISVDSVGHWKPRPEPYWYAAEVAGVPAEQVALVAGHPWDIHGASRAGLLTGWVNRDGRRYPEIFRAPHVQARDLDGVVEKLLALSDD